MSGPLAERLAAGGPILLDGAMGSELDHRGVHTYLPLWSAIGLISHPEVVEEIHRDYANAGAEVAITNTFRTTRRMLERAGRPGDEALALNALAVQLARSGTSEAGRPVLVAGSIAPLEDCYSPELSPDADTAKQEHREQACLLAAAGVDFIMIETMPLIREAVAALEAARETGLETTVGFVLGSDGHLLSGETLGEAVDALRDFSVAAILVNCTPAGVVTSAMKALRQLTDLPIGGYANLGVVEETVGWRIDDSVSGEAYAEQAMSWFDAGASIIGGCCGTRPGHIAALRQAIDARAISML